MTFHPEAFGKYYLVDKIAVGGMAEIFKAKQFGPGGFEKVLVIKRILSHLSEDHDFVEMFHDEAMISSKLSHSNIIHVYEFGKIRNNYFIAMEYCEGKDLKTLMKKCQEIGRPLPIEYAVYIIHEICKGLDYAHRKKDENDQEMNILHRDVSPSNIIISYDEGEVKIADFGIAKAARATYQTKSGVLKGKFEYMSPEQASGLPVDRRSDVFSVGICLYEILTRRRLFKTSSDLKTLELIRNPLIPPPSHLTPQVSEDLDAIVMKALARNPDDRYQEAWQLQHDLREYMRCLTPPTSPDLVALSLAKFVQEVFAREIRQERERLELGSRIARELMLDNRELTLEVGVEENWDIPSGSSRETGMTPPQGETALRLMIEEKKRSSTNRAILIGSGAGALIVVIVLGLFYGWGGAGDRLPGSVRPGLAGTGAVEEGVEKRNERGRPRATLRVRTKPGGAVVYLDGELIGKSPLVYDEMTAGEVVRLRIEHDGYLPYLEPLFVKVDGEPLELDVELEPMEMETPDRFMSAPKTARASAETGPSQGEPVPSSPPAAGHIELTSVPAGAAVYADGAFFCHTPCNMEKGRAGTSYELEFRMGGYEPYRTRAKFPAQGVVPVKAALKKMAMGRLTLTIKDGLSAEVFIDGKLLGPPSPGHSLNVRAGARRIKLRNQLAGLEKELTVEIEPGKETKMLDIDLRE